MCGGTRTSSAVPYAMKCLLPCTDEYAQLAQPHACQTTRLTVAPYDTRTPCAYRSCRIIHVRELWCLGDDLQLIMILPRA